MERHIHLFLVLSHEQIVKLRQEDQGLSEAKFTKVLLPLKLLGSENRFNTNIHTQTRHISDVK